MKNMDNKKTILVLNGEYAPGYKGGGPIQSCINLVENLYEIYNFKILCSDRDTGSKNQFPNIEVNCWNTVGHAQVYYSDKNGHSFKGLIKFFKNTNYDILYMNGFFSPIYTFRVLVLSKLGLIRLKNVIITPRGDFTGGCKNKKLKKYIYILCIKFFELTKSFNWQATSEAEAADIKKIFPDIEPFVVANLPLRYVPKCRKNKKEVGLLKIVYISRIFPKKNLHFALECLKQIKDGIVYFDIYGPKEDENYWEKCEKVISELPQNIIVNYKGEIDHSMVADTFSEYHAFLFPTSGENYGHAIVESMMNNCLCIMGEGVTPWDDYLNLLDLGGKLQDKESFERIIYRLVSLNDNDFNEMVEMGNQYLIEKIKPENDKNKYQSMFNQCYMREGM